MVNSLCLSHTKVINLCIRSIYTNSSYIIRLPFFLQIHTLTIPNDTTYRNTDDDHNRASESPTQPPPSPDVSFSKEPVKPPSPPKIKKPITKKTLEKKPFNKKKKEDMEKPVEVPPPPREPTPPPPPPVEEK